MVESKPLLPLMFFLVLLFNFGIEEVQCSSRERKLLSLKKLQGRKLNPISTCHPQKSRRENGGYILEMKHKDYCSGHIKNWDDELQNRLITDSDRVEFLQSKIKKHVTSKNLLYKTSTEIPLNSGIQLLTLNYIVTVQLGKRNMTVIVDTGSDLTWVQCEPCTSCYNQQDALLNPSKSRSYSSVSCNSSTCKFLQSATGFSGVCGNNQETCNYIVNYGDGSYTRGELGRELLFIGKTYVKDFIFGCGRNNKGLFGGASGLMGLGKSSLSLVSQTYKKFDGVFSYCLPISNADSSGSLNFGRDSSTYKNSTPISYTRMIPDPMISHFYFLNFTGISIGGVEVKASGFTNSRTLIDSGTVITRLVPSVYNAVKTEFLKQFSGYPVAPSFSILDTCFNLTSYGEINVPTLTMKFDGVIEVNVDVDGMFYFGKSDGSQVCLALASLSSEDDVGIIGNFQQKNLRVIYDIKNSKLGFAEESCKYT